MITYSFPPKGGGGVLRQHKFAKYLPQFQWQPFILTGDKYCFFQDRKLLEELSDSCRILRLYYPNLRSFFNLQNRPMRVNLYAADKLYLKRSRRNISKRLLENIVSFLKSIFSKLLIPDAYIGWFFPAAYRGLRIIKDENIDAIYSIDNPCSNHIVALILKIFSKKPWIADFKDPWIKGFGSKNPRPFPLSWFDYSLQKLVLAHCDVCISSDKRIENILKSSLPKRQDKFIVITNGFDREDFEGELPKRQDGIFKIVYVGTVYKDMSPHHFLCAVLNLLESKAILEGQIKIIFVGAHEYQDTFNELAYQLLLKKGVLQEIGLVSHEESIRYMRDADLLLLINKGVPDSQSIIPSKIYEYLASGKPILALVDEGGVCALFIRKFGYGYIVWDDDERSICDAIMRAFKQYKDKGIFETKQSENWLQPYERKVICGNLAKILHNLTNSKSRN